MGEDILPFGGPAFRGSITTSDRGKINSFIQRRFGAEGHEKEQQIREKIFSHPYLVLDPWAEAEHREQIARYKRLQKLLGGLKHRLVRGELVQEGFDKQSGHPHLTIDQLGGPDREVLLAEVADGVLLLEIERHPHGGGTEVDQQYWLYQPHARRLLLLKQQSESCMTNLPMMVKTGDGPLVPPSTVLRDDFFSQIELAFGDEWPDRFRALFKYQPVRLLNPPDDILEQCKALTGIDYKSAEEGRKRRFDAECLKKYGTRPPGLPDMSISYQAGIRLEYADTPTTTIDAGSTEPSSATNISPVVPSSAIKT
jgi:hypothetical protein